MYARMCIYILYIYIYTIYTLKIDYIYYIYVYIYILHRAKGPSTAVFLIFCVLVNIDE